MQMNSIKTLTGYIIAVIYFLIAIIVIIASIKSPILPIVIVSSLIIGVVLWFFYIWLVKYF